MIFGIQSTGFAKSKCGNSPQAAQLAQLIRQHAQQSRTQLTCSSQLSTIAEHKAELLSQHNIIMHSIGHLTPNQLLRDNGYPLSKGYPVLGNQVEAIAAGETNAKATLNQLLNSKIHRRLLLGKAPFYSPQNEIGVAYLKQATSPYEHYWVIYVADTNTGSRSKPKTEYTVSYDFSYDANESSTVKDDMTVRKRHNQFRNKRLRMNTDQ